MRFWRHQRRVKLKNRATHDNRFLAEPSLVLGESQDAEKSDACLRLRSSARSVLQPRICSATIALLLKRSKSPEPTRIDCRQFWNPQGRRSR